MELAHRRRDAPTAASRARSSGSRPRRRAEARREAPAPSAPGEDPVDAWRHAFLFAPYLRDSLVACGVLSDTFETAITWDRFPDFHAEVMETARRAVAEASGGPAEGRGSPRISCRFTHVYPDGPAPYYTVLAQARRGDEVEQWDEIKAAVSETLIDARRDDHPPPRRRPRPPALVRPPAPGPLRGRAAGRQARARPEGRAQPGRADRARPRRIGAFSPHKTGRAFARPRISATTLLDSWPAP